MERYTINIALRGQHYAKVEVPQGTSLDGAQQIARTFDIALRNYMILTGGQDHYTLDLSCWIEISKDIDIWGATR